MMNSKIYLAIESVTLIVIPIILLFLPADFFDEGQSVCLSVQLFGKECHACGLTRATMHFMHFDFQEAIFYNPFVFIVLPLIGWFVFLRLKRNIKQLI
ncbi:MAG: DUF2752 domain-containing protein [Bacteroidota bacterium]